MSHFEAHRTQIVHRMFVATADENYILARIAFQQHFAFDFLWLSLHALEKYFKATRLLNGMPRQDGHDIATLHAEFIRRFPGLIPTKFDFSKQEKQVWRRESVREFIIRLNTYGAAENRYATYGYGLFPDELAKIDSLIWSVRRCCVNFASYSQFINETDGEPEGVALFKSSPKAWMVSGSLPLERLLSVAGDPDIKRLFIDGNKPWGAETWLAGATRWASSTPPLSELIRFARSEDEGARTESQEVLKWARDNIYFSPDVLHELDEAIAFDGSSRSTAVQTGKRHGT